MTSINSEGKIQNIGWSDGTHSREHSNSTLSENKPIGSSDVEEVTIIPAPEDGHAKLSLLAASVFIVGEMAGSGVLALPAAVKGCGWTGIALIVLCCIASAQAAVYLGRCWMIVEERWPEFKNMDGDPYSIIGLQSVGKKMKTFVTLNVQIQLFGVAIVFLILCSGLVFDLLKSHVGISECTWILIIGLMTCPLMWLPTPAEITFIAYTAMSCTAISCVLIFVLYIQVGINEGPSHVPNDVTYSSFFLSLGTIAFAYGGAATFPTFQNYMKNKRDFPKAVGAGFSLMLLLYLPVAIGGFFLYSGGVKDNILNNLPVGGLRTTIDILMAFHVFAALLIVINPVNMSFEQKLNISNNGKISWKKCIMRTLVCMAMIFVALTVPRFGKILNLVGGATVSFTSFIFPPLFYMLLAKESGDWKGLPISITTKIVCFSIAGLGLLGGIVATVTAVQEIVSPDALTIPCYC